MIFYHFKIINNFNIYILKFFEIQLNILLIFLNYDYSVL